MIRSISQEGKVSVRGNGWKRPKFHAQLHLPKWITDFGSPANYNTHQFESNHKIIVKNVANHVQKRAMAKLYHNWFGEDMNGSFCQPLWKKWILSQ